jgi:acyl transferase domain-containing protein
MILEARRVKSKRLAVPSPFHTPLLKAAADTLAKTIQALPIAAPHIAAFSSTTTHLLAGPAEIRESLLRQMTETVRWVTVVEKLYAAGVRTFVEVGPSGVLSGLTRRILAGCADVQCVQFDARSRTPLEHLEKVRQQLGMAGALRSTAPLPAASEGGVAHGGVVSFDATARRRARNRAGTGVSRPASTRQPVGTAAANSGDVYASLDPGRITG